VTICLDQIDLNKILTGDVRALLSAIKDAGGRAFVVGGAVRDVIVKRAIGDIDIATDLPPNRVIDALSDKDIKVVPTGLKHGTVTAVLRGKGYEITTLRRDEETDGRHANVAFTDDLREDAARRDFTFNALYIDESGEVQDFFGGVEDARAGCVRFIGDARARIREDVLRILRFFRFYAYFGQGLPDAEAVSACKELAHLIPKLSAERVAKEMIKLLAARDPIGACKAMIECGVASFVSDALVDKQRLETLIEAERETGIASEGIVRLSAWLPFDTAAAERVAEALKLSKRDREILRVLSFLPEELRKEDDKKASRRKLYEYGVEFSKHALLMNGSAFAKRYLSVVVAWESPVFPVKGKDAMKVGFVSGEELGLALQHVEKWWISRDFQDGKEACLERLKEVRKNH